MTEMSKPKQIIIVGGSLAGLMTGISLKRLGHNVTILERSPVPLLHDQGAGIVAGGDTLEWMQQHGRRTADEISVRSGERLYLNRSGEVTDREARGQRMTSWGMLYSIGRSEFDGMNLDASTKKSTNGEGESKYEYGRRVTGISENGSQVEVAFEKIREEGEEGSGEKGSVVGDFLILADGPSSQMRKSLLGESTAQRTYAGYVAFRGTVSESELSESAKAVFVERFTFFHGTNPNTQILAYTIPNAENSLEQGKRFINWVWYHNVDFDSDEYANIMTDKNGVRHRFTLPTGGYIQAQVWDSQKQIAESRLPPQFAELVTKTQKPFVQAITDLKPPSNKKEVARLMAGKALIIGDALAGFRPHTAASTSQAAFHALGLEKVFRGEMTWDDYEDMVFKFAVSWQAHGVHLGDRSQFGHHPLAD